MHLSTNYKLRSTIQRSRLSKRQATIFKNAINTELTDLSCIDFEQWYNNTCTKAHLSQVLPKTNDFFKIDPNWIQQIFAQPGKLILDLGFGDGDQLIELAHKFPNYNFLGIELYKKGIVKTIEQINNLKITNLKIFYGNIQIILPRIATTPWLAQIQIFFPDPWPKRRHHKRRLIQSELIYLFSQFLIHHGILYIVTDSSCYARQISNIMTNFPEFTQIDLPPFPRSTTKFEKIARSCNRDVWELIFVLNSDLKIKKIT